MSFDGIRKFAAKTIQVDIVGRHMEIQPPVGRQNRPVEIHIYQGRKDMEIVKGQQTVFQRVIPIHPREEIPSVTAVAKMDVPYDVGIIQRSRNRDDIVHLAGNGLLRRH